MRQGRCIFGWFWPISAHWGTAKNCCYHQFLRILGSLGGSRSPHKLFLGVIGPWNDHYSGLFSFLPLRSSPKSQTTSLLAPWTSWVPFNNRKGDKVLLANETQCMVWISVWSHGSFEVVWSVSGQ